VSDIKVQSILDDFINPSKTIEGAERFVINNAKRVVTVNYRKGSIDFDMACVKPVYFERMESFIRTHFEGASITIVD